MKNHNKLDYLTFYVFLDYEKEPNVQWSLTKVAFLFYRVVQFAFERKQPLGV